MADNAGFSWLEAVAVPPFTDAAWFTLTVGVGPGEAEGVGDGDVLGVAVGVGVGVELAPDPLQASSSTILLYPSCAELITTLIFEVLMGVKASFFKTRLLPDIFPPGTFTHPVPFQYWTSKLMIP
jgi:hypothetical protein